MSIHCPNCRQQGKNTIYAATLGRCPLCQQPAPGRILLELGVGKLVPPKTTNN